MKIGIITPTSGSRDLFLKRSILYVDRQTLPVNYRVIVTGTRSLARNYQTGIDMLKDKSDLIFFIEDDDYYDKKYIEKMVRAWRRAGEPDIFGIGETYFYHPEFNGVWYRMHNGDSPCAFQMCLKTSALDKIDWSLINETFIDVGLWSQLKGKSVIFDSPVSIGIKHGRGACLAGGHNRWFYEDKIKSPGLGEWAKFDPKWLREQIGNDAEWYENLLRNS